MYPWHGLWRLALLLTRKLLFLWVRTRTIDAQVERLTALAGKPVCYVLERPGIADLAVLEQECLRKGMPRPSAGLDAGRGGGVARSGLPEADPAQAAQAPGRRLERLAEAVQAERVEEVAIIPVSVFWGRSPEKERSLFKLLFAEGWGLAGRLRRLFMIVFHGRDVLLQFSEPVLLSGLVAEGRSPALVARKLSRVLRVHFRRLRIATIGPDLSHRRTLVNQVLNSESVRRAIRRDSEVNKLPAHKSVAKARRYTNEIAANYSYTTVRVMERLLTWLWQRLYDGVEVAGIERLKAVAAGNEVIYVPCHRSHIDYLLLSYVVYRDGLVPPHIAAGVNLNLPVIGPVLRSGGAFFMRRSFPRRPALCRGVSQVLLAQPRQGRGHRVLHRGRPQPHRPASARQAGDAGDDGPRLPARTGTPGGVRARVLRLRAPVRGVAPTSRSCPAAPSRRRRCSASSRRYGSCAASSVACTSISAHRSSSTRSSTHTDPAGARNRSGRTKSRAGPRRWSPRSAPRC
jgi:glycerol-3-phosphate O-acyltransferase